MNSMTGFSFTKGTTLFGEIELEFKTVNSKTLDINIRLPRVLSLYENKFREWIQNYIFRGKVNLFINISNVNPDFASEKIDPSMVKYYKSLLTDLNTAAGIKTEITTNHLLQFKDIFYKDETKEPDIKTTNNLQLLANEALKKLVVSRKTEGEILKKDFSQRLETLQLLIKEIAPIAKENPQIAFDKQMQRLKDRLKVTEFDENRMIQELAILSDKVDVTEEIVRFKSHLKLFKATLDKNEPVGKKLNFILQEMHRELNTLSVKTTIVDISHKVVIMKEEVERIREQVQNIE